MELLSTNHHDTNARIRLLLQKQKNVNFVFWHNLTHFPNRYLLMEDLSEAFML